MRHSGLRIQADAASCCVENETRGSLRKLQADLHAFGGGADFGVIILRVGDYLVDDDVAVVGIVMVENQFLGAAFHHDVDGLAPVAVSPAAAAGGVFFGKILRVVDEDVGAFG